MSLSLKSLSYLLTSPLSYRIRLSFHIKLKLDIVMWQIFWFSIEVLWHFLNNSYQQYWRCCNFIIIKISKVIFRRWISGMKIQICICIMLPLFINTRCTEANKLKTTKIIPSGYRCARPPLCNIYTRFHRRFDGTYIENGVYNTTVHSSGSSGRSGGGSRAWVWPFGHGEGVEKNGVSGLSSSGLDPLPSRGGVCRLAG